MHKNEIQNHLHSDYKVSPVSEYLREIVYGGTDGIVTTFAVVAGFTGASISGSIEELTFVTVLLFGLSNLFADASSMGLGNFLSIRSEKEVYKNEKKKELKEIKNNTQFERGETILILKEKGYSEEDAMKMVDLYAKNEDYWLEFMMNHELKLPNPEGTNPFYTGIITTISFISFEFIPLSPYIFLEDVQSAFLASIFGALIALLLLGVFRWKVSKQNLVKAILETVILGGVSATIAYLVGSLF